MAALAFVDGVVRAVCCVAVLVPVFFGLFWTHVIAILKSVHLTLRNLYWCRIRSTNGYARFYRIKTPT